MPFTDEEWNLGSFWRPEKVMKCYRCGFEMIDISCRIKCTNCGYSLDCSDM